MQEQEIREIEEKMERYYESLFDGKPLFALFDEEETETHEEEGELPF